MFTIKFYGNEGRTERVYGHLQLIHLQRFRLYGPPKFKPFAGKHLQLLFCNLQLFHLQQLTFSKIGHLQQE